MFLWLHGPHSSQGNYWSPLVLTYPLVGCCLHFPPSATQQFLPSYISRRAADTRLYIRGYLQTLGEACRALPRDSLPLSTWMVTPIWDLYCAVQWAPIQGWGASFLFFLMPSVSKSDYPATLPTSWCLEGWGSTPLQSCIKCLSPRTQKLVALKFLFLAPFSLWDYTEKSFVCARRGGVVAVVMVVTGMVLLNIRKPFVVVHFRVWCL